MKIIRSLREMVDFSKSYRLKQKTIGFVPTMGALHDGHLRLIKQARKDNQVVIVSIFVNPAQFGPREDFKKYPGNLTKDALFCKKEGVDAIFCPDAGKMYPKNYKTFVTVQGLSDILCGKSRPGHFKGVATVVLKLFNIVQPDYAYFGQKDAQQAAVIKTLVRDLNIPVKIKVVPTVRANDTVALSSRNQYLNAQERIEAQVIPRALNIARVLIQNHIKDPNKVISAMRKIILKAEGAKIDYISIVDKQNFKRLKKISNGCVIVLAVWINKTRLIDNMIVNLTKRTF
ncbi:MAG: pantoate--beta-alanine ligase [Candidatus Omnitrophota bacterium]